MCVSVSCALTGVTLSSLIYVFTHSSVGFEFIYPGTVATVVYFDVEMTPIGTGEPFKPALPLVCLQRS